MSSIKVFFKLTDTDETSFIEFNPSSANNEIKTKLSKAARIKAKDDDKVVLKLYDKSGYLVNFTSLVANTPTDAYTLQYIVNEDTKVHQTTQEVLAEINSLAEHVLALKLKAVQPKNNAASTPQPQAEEPADKLMNKPAIKRVATAIQMPLDISALKTALPNFTSPSDLGKTSYDIWASNDDQIILLLRDIFSRLGLLETFKISDDTLFSFLKCIQILYNNNPFHNFRHCLCVTQMMFAILSESNTTQKLSAVERLTLVIACIGHDLDHPGYNNAYQINAGTELAIIYNDTSPLENHHAAVLFTILKLPEANLIKLLSDNEQKEFRRDCVACILATDMAKHGEITGKFKAIADSFIFEDETQRKLLMQMIIKCSDISNEVRPQKLSEPWVDSLLEEFFTQSDREKAEGLPTAPFMDRQKVTKSSAQVGFIGFVMIPLYELVAKVLPNIDSGFLAPIRQSLAYYKSL